MSSDYKLFLCSIWGLVLVGCNEQSIELPPLPQGIQKISGQLVPVELSLVRRGTHVLLQEGIERYFVESKMTALRAFEGKKVQIHGVLEKNVDPTYLPVLIAEQVEEDAIPWQTIHSDVLYITIDVPPEWQVKKSNNEILLFAPSSERNAIVRIAQEESLRIPTGTPIRIGGRTGTRILDEKNGHQEIFFLYDNQLLSITFMPKDPVHLLEERTLFLRLLHSIIFNENPEKHSSSLGALPSQKKGSPCGGSAGILCQDGFYCEISDLKEGIGRCIKITTEQ